MKPEQVLHNWDVFKESNINSFTIKRANSGLLNKTYIIRANSELYILQSVHPAVSMDGAMNNYFHVTQFFKKQALVTQIIIPTINDKLWIDDIDGDKWRWRLLLGVEGEVYDKTTGVDLTDTQLAEEAGKLMSQFHVVLSEYPEKLETGLPMFQYDQHIAKLHQFQKELMADADESIRNATELALRELPKLMLPDDLPQRIIHADPKISNILFTKEGKGICMIDLDTVQLHSPLFDIADAVRSWCGQSEDDPNNTFSEEIYNAFLKGYLATSKRLLSEQEQLLIPQACKLVMLGLATRFLNDYIEDSYFGWDETRYQSRKDHNKARALGQISLYRTYIKLT